MQAALDDRVRKKTTTLSPSQCRRRSFRHAAFQLRGTRTTSLPRHQAAWSGRHSRRSTEKPEPAATQALHKAVDHKQKRYTRRRLHKRYTKATVTQALHETTVTQALHKTSAARRRNTNAAEYTRRRQTSVTQGDVTQDGGKNTGTVTGTEKEIKSGGRNSRPKRGGMR